MSRLIIVVSSAVALLVPPAEAATRHPSRHATRRVSVTAVKAFDTTATIDNRAWFAGMAARGFRLYVLHSTQWGTCTPWPNAPGQIKMALDAGLAVAVYTRDPRCWRAGIRAARPYVGRLQFFALDVESDPGIRVTQAMVDGVTSLGVRPVIYTGAGMWPPIMGPNNSGFAEVPLWDTDTRSTSLGSWLPDVFSPYPAQYGGWNTAATMRRGVQQAFDVVVDGVTVDLSSFDAAFLK